MINSKTQNLSISTGTPIPPFMVDEIKERYDWYTFADDGDLSVKYHSTVFKYGRYSVEMQKASFSIIFGLADLVGPDGNICYPFSDDYACFEKAQKIVKFADKLIVGGPEGAKCALYRGVYDSTRTKFTLEHNNPSHLLFVSDRCLCGGGKMYCCDVIYIHDVAGSRNIYAMPIPMDKARYILRDNKI